MTDWKGALPMLIRRTRELLPSMKKRAYGSSLPPLTIELAVFFDCAATRSFLRFWDDDSAEVVDFMLSLVNAMQVCTSISMG